MSFTPHAGADGRNWFHNTIVFSNADANIMIQNIPNYSIESQKQSRHNSRQIQGTESMVILSNTEA